MPQRGFHMLRDNERHDIQANQRRIREDLSGEKKLVGKQGVVLQNYRRL